MVTSKNDVVKIRQSCPVCKSAKRSVLFSARHDSAGFSDFLKFERFYSKSFYDNYNTGALKELVFEIAECDKCHLIYLTEVLNDKGMRLLYNEWLDQDMLKEYYSNQEYHSNEEVMLRVLKRYFKGQEKINIMDFGAGYGNFCAIATKLGFNTYAYDLSTEKNEQLNTLGVRIINKFDNFEGYFDLIYISQVMEHLADPAEILQKLRPCLAENGLVFLAVPDCKDLRKILKTKELNLSLFRLLNAHQHINAFDNHSLKQLGIEAGLKPLYMLDFLAMFSASFSKAESVYWLKRFLKNSLAGTNLFFRAA